jgi:hypothetical protein
VSPQPVQTAPNAVVSQNSYNQQVVGTAIIKHNIVVPTITVQPEVVNSVVKQEVTTVPAVTTTTQNVVTTTPNIVTTTTPVIVTTTPAVVQQYNSGAVTFQGTQRIVTQQHVVNQSNNVSTNYSNNVSANNVGVNYSNNNVGAVGHSHSVNIQRNVNANFNNHHNNVGAVGRNRSLNINIQRNSNANRGSGLFGGILGNRSRSVVKQKTVTRQVNRSH